VERLVGLPAPKRPLFGSPRRRAGRTGAAAERVGDLRDHRRERAAGVQAPEARDPVEHITERAQVGHDDDAPVGERDAVLGEHVGDVLAQASRRVAEMIGGAQADQRALSEWVALKGLYHAHIGWLFNTKGMERGAAWGGDLYKDGVIRTIDWLSVV